MAGHFPAAGHPFAPQLALASAPATTIFLKRIASRSAFLSCNRVQMSQIRNICVYGGAGPGRDPDFVAAARQFGKALADNGIGLVYGGGSVGLMGETANAVLDNGGHVTGIIPDFLANREHMMRRGEIIRTRD